MLIFLTHMTELNIHIGLLKQFSVQYVISNGSLSQFETSQLIFQVSIEFLNLKQMNKILKLNQAVYTLISIISISSFSINIFGNQVAMCSQPVVCVGTPPSHVDMTGCCQESEENLVSDLDDTTADQPSGKIKIPVWTTKTAR